MNFDNSTGNKKIIITGRGRGIRLYKRSKNDFAI